MYHPVPLVILQNVILFNDPENVKTISCNMGFTFLYYTAIIYSILDIDHSLCRYCNL